MKLLDTHRLLIAVAALILNAILAVLFCGQVGQVARNTAAISDHRTDLENATAAFESGIADLDGARAVLDGRGRVRSWNKGAENIFGWSADDMDGQDVRRLFPTIDDWRAHDEQLRAAMKIAAADDEYGNQQVLTCWARNQAGDLVHLQLTVRIESKDGEPVAVALFAPAESVRDAGEFPKPNEFPKPRQSID